MITATRPVEIMPVTVKLEPVIQLTEEQFFDFCRANRNYQIERNARGDIVIMPPVGWETSNKNALIVSALYTWAVQNATGFVTDSSAGFHLPNGAVRSPDAAWIKRTRLARATETELHRFLPLAPDFVIELRSTSDRLWDLQAKMSEYSENGVAMGWLIDPTLKQVHVYRPDTPVKILQTPDSLAADPELPGFVLDLRPIWQSVWYNA